MSDIDSIIPQSHTVELFGQTHELNFTFRHLAAVQKKFGVSPFELCQGLVNGDIPTIVMALWGGTLVFGKFDVADPLKIRQEIDAEKLYSLPNSELIGVITPVLSAVFAAMPKKNEELADEEEDDKKPAKSKNGGFLEKCYWSWVFYLATVIMNLTEAAFWLSTPRKLDALTTQHGVANGVLETKEAQVAREIENVNKFMGM